MLSAWITGRITKICSDYRVFGASFGLKKSGLVSGVKKFEGRSFFEVFCPKNVPTPVYDGRKDDKGVNSAILIRKMVENIIFYKKWHNIESQMAITI